MGVRYNPRASWKHICPGWISLDRLEEDSLAYVGNRPATLKQLTFDPEDSRACHPCTRSV